MINWDKPIKFTERFAGGKPIVLDKTEHYVVIHYNSDNGKNYAILNRSNGTIMSTTRTGHTYVGQQFVENVPEPKKEWIGLYKHKGSSNWAVEHRGWDVHYMTEVDANKWNEMADAIDQDRKIVKVGV